MVAMKKLNNPITLLSILFELLINLQKLKQQLKQLGYKLSVYREELLEWSEEKKEFDEIEEVQASFICGNHPPSLHAVMHQSYALCNNLC